MSHLTRMLWEPILAAGLLFLVGCAKEPVRVNMVLAAAPNVNPDSSGQALSVVVRVYQLKDKGRLEAADFNAVWKSDRDILSDDFLDLQEYVVQPGAQELLEIRANPLAAYLGVVALFQNHTGNTWRQIIPIRGDNPKIRLSLREQNIEISSVSE
jgi:type VI secretion system protein VasD